MNPAPSEPLTPDLPKYLVENIERQSPDRLETIATWASELAEHKRKIRELEAEHQREERGIDDEQREELEKREISMEPDDYENVPENGAYITVKTIDENDYFYWQWRSESSKRAPDKSKYISPVKPKD
ncbi:hypothetical protein [Halorussus halophilus]|uniref:hypothetical protein n=1 Tax=Halorussus halophilus TaxID=2650975 RepID=UPI001301101D|nr:hypothetical protein [Halorussus halophilus]